MDWAQRELSVVSSRPLTPYDNFHTMLHRAGVLTSPTTGAPNGLARAMMTLFGNTTPQRTVATLQRTWTEFLNVLEESIQNELTFLTLLFTLSERVDQLFLNIQRILAREQDTQDRAESEFLSALWTRITGGDKSQMKKYEKNRLLLGSLRQVTTVQKHLLVEYNSRLVQVKANLEILRRNLVSPLVRGNLSTTQTVQEQIGHLGTTYGVLSGVREKQKQKMMEMVYGAGNAHKRIEERRNAKLGLAGDGGGGGQS